MLHAETHSWIFPCSKLFRVLFLSPGESLEENSADWTPPKRFTSRYSLGEVKFAQLKEHSSGFCENVSDVIKTCIRPVCRLSGVGETEDGVELHVQDEVKDEEGLLVHRAGNKILLNT